MRDKIAAGSPEFQEKIREDTAVIRERARYHSIRLPDGRILPGLHSLEQLEARLAVFNLPLNLSGTRVLDIGAWDGWFSFEMERRGAEVVAVDCVELETFLEARELRGSKVDYRILDVSELSVDILGSFDIVLFFGVLYHLRHPLLGLERVVELSTDLALVESFVTEASLSGAKSLEFYETDELGGQIDNWCGPTPDCLLALCRSAGFARVELTSIEGQRASVTCHRRWEPPPANPVGEPPVLHSALNNRNFQPRFHLHKDEYICCFFSSTEPDLTRVRVFVEIDGFGVQALSVTGDGEGGWQVNCLKPPALKAGRHEVRLRTSSSNYSNAVEIQVDGKELGLGRA